jgi:hypothetical protein
MKEDTTETAQLPREKRKEEIMEILYCIVESRVKLK